MFSLESNIIYDSSFNVENKATHTAASSTLRFVVRIEKPI